MIIYAEKPFDNIHHLFLLKILERALIKGIYIDIIKAMYSTSITNIKLNERLKATVATKLHQ